MREPREFLPDFIASSKIDFVLNFKWNRLSKKIANIIIDFGKSCIQFKCGHDWILNTNCSLCVLDCSESQYHDQINKIITKSWNESTRASKRTKHRQRQHRQKRQKNSSLTHTRPYSTSIEFYFCFDFVSYCWICISFSNIIVLYKLNEEQQQQRQRQTQNREKNKNNTKTNSFIRGR